MKIIPLAAESLGVRSMATYVECGRCRILLDPGATLGPRRYGLPPADVEWEALRRANDRISAYAVRSELLFVSHYHEDHFRYDSTLYQGRSVWAKDPRHMINPMQGRRASELWASLKAGCWLDSAEGKQRELPDAILKASPPLAHGLEGTGLGYVVALTVTDRTEGFRFVFASDVQGPVSPVVTAYLVRESPHCLYLSGPPTYLEHQVGSKLIDEAIDNLRRIIGETGCQVILDHHALRDARHRERLARVWDTGKVVTAAEHLRVPVACLEASRDRLWAERRDADGPKLNPRLSSSKMRSNISRTKGGRSA
ncbi:MAG: hypothetical protein ACE5JD_12245 [Candidatus Methylomirabilia bacterium]